MSTVQLRGLRRQGLTAAWTALLLVLLAAPAQAAGGLELSIHLRAPQPGEPVRITACGPARITRPNGTLLGRALDFFPLEAAERCWAAWGVIPLDTKPRREAITIEALDGDGAMLRGSTSLTVLAKRFPTEQLKVEPRYAEPPPEVQERLAAERKLTAAIYGRRSPSAPVTSAFLRPVPGPPTSTFGKRRVFNGKPRDPHPGLDLRAASGTPVQCSGPGTIALARELYYSGQTVIVDHGGGLFTVYAHLSRIDVNEGDVVAAGLQLGLSGATGRVTGPHLHWGGKLGETPFDPTALLDAKLFPAD